MSTQGVPVKAAERVAKELGLDAVIIVGFTDRSYATTSYGKDRATCRAFASVCDQIHEDIRSGMIHIPGVE